MVSFQIRLSLFNSDNYTLTSLRLYADLLDNICHKFQRQYPDFVGKTYTNTPIQTKIIKSENTSLHNMTEWTLWPNIYIYRERDRDREGVREGGGSRRKRRRRREMVKNCSVHSFLSCEKGISLFVIVIWISPIQNDIFILKYNVRVQQAVPCCCYDAWLMHDDVIKWKHFPRW